MIFWLCAFGDQCLWRQAIVKADATRVTTKMIPFALFLTAWRRLHVAHKHYKPCSWLQWSCECLVSMISGISLTGPDPFRYCTSTRERVWELARVLSCNVCGNARLGVLWHFFERANQVIITVRNGSTWRLCKDWSCSAYNGCWSRPQELEAGTSTSGGRVRSWAQCFSLPKENVL